MIYAQIVTNVYRSGDVDTISVVYTGAEADLGRLFPECVEAIRVESGDPTETLTGQENEFDSESEALDELGMYGFIPVSETFFYTARYESESATHVPAQGCEKCLKGNA